MQSSASKLGLLLWLALPMQCREPRVLIVPDFDDIHADPGWYGKPTYYADYVAKTEKI